MAPEKKQSQEKPLCFLFLFLAGSLFLVSSAAAWPLGLGTSGGGGSNMLRFYTDDVPGLKISHTVVLVISVCFIGFVTALRVIGKLYLH